MLKSFFYLLSYIIFVRTLKQFIMKTFKISFQDISGNELWMSITEQFTIEDARKYAQLIYATSMVNDLAQYEISEF